MSETFAIVPNVCSVSDPDGTTILDFRGNRIYSLIGIGSIVWSQLASSSRSLTFDELLERLSNQFNAVARVQIEQDLTALLASFRNCALVQSAHETSMLESSFRQTLFRAVLLGVRTILTVLLTARMTAVAAIFCLAAITLTLKTAGFDSLCKALRTWPVSSRSRAVQPESAIPKAVERAALWYPRLALCLQKSAAVAVLLRESGIACEMVIACRRLPFKAHAWVEVNGRVVNDNVKVQQVFKELARL